MWCFVKESRNEQKYNNFRFYIYISRQRWLFRLTLIVIILFGANSGYLIDVNNLASAARCR